MELAIGNGSLGRGAFALSSWGTPLSKPPVPPGEPEESPQIQPLSDNSRPYFSHFGSWVDSSKQASTVDEAPKIPLPGRYLVILREEADPMEVAKEHGIEMKEGDLLSGVNILVTRLTPALVDILKKDARIEFIEEDQEVSDRSRVPMPVIAQTASGQNPQIGNRVDIVISETVSSPPKESGGGKNRYLIGVRSHRDIDQLIAEFKLKVEQTLRLNAFYADLTREMLDRLGKDPRLSLMQSDSATSTGLKPSSKWSLLSDLVAYIYPGSRRPRGRRPLLPLPPGQMPLPTPPVVRPRPQRPSMRKPVPPPSPTPRLANPSIALAQQIIPTGVDRIDAERSTKTGRGVGVAILDTGIDASHPDLARNVRGGASFVPDEPTLYDFNGHGTHVAGIVAALDNGIGVRGVAPEANLYAVKVLGGNGGGSISGVIKGVNYVANHVDQIQLANMSLGASGVNQVESQALQIAIRRATQKGVTFIVAAGNEGKANYGTIPAAFPEAITVTALADTDGKQGGQGPANRAGEDDSFASFSNYGKADIAAPGVGILSTLPGGGYGTMSGTSQAAPHVAGVAALYLQNHPGARFSEIKTALVGASTRSGLSPYALANQSTRHPESVVTAWV